MYCIELKIIDKNSIDIEFFEKLNEEAFPKFERIDLVEMLTLAEKESIDVLGIYDISKPIGFAVIIKNKLCGYLWYLAIDKEQRGKNYGSFAIKSILEKYSDLQIVLDFEKIDENAENIEQRIKRKNFYIKNGFYETGKYITLSGENFEVVCNKKQFVEREFIKILKIIHSYYPEFLDTLV